MKEERERVWVRTADCDGDIPGQRQSACFA